MSKAKWIDDPFPGQCHHDRDADGDGICDDSGVGSGSDSAGLGGAGRRTSLPGRHAGRGRP